MQAMLLNGKLSQRRNSCDAYSKAEAIMEEYPSRQLHESAYRTLKHGHHGDALPKAYRLERVENQQGEDRRTVSTKIVAMQLWIPPGMAMMGR